MSRKASFVLRVIYAACLLGATCTHVTMLWQHGLLWDYGGAHLFTRIYWTSLTVLDPLAALLLFVRPRSGLVLTAAIISSDVLHNILVGVPSLNAMYISQVIFLLFVGCTVYVAWGGVLQSRTMKPRYIRARSRQRRLSSFSLGGINEPSGGADAEV